MGAGNQFAVLKMKIKVGKRGERERERERAHVHSWMRGSYAKVNSNLSGGKLMATF